MLRSPSLYQSFPGACESLEMSPIVRNQPSTFPPPPPAIGSSTPNTKAQAPERQLINLDTPRPVLPPGFQAENSETKFATFRETGTYIERQIPMSDLAETFAADFVTTSTENKTKKCSTPVNPAALM